jgi:hypothetical protein
MLLRLLSQSLREHGAYIRQRANLSHLRAVEMAVDGDDAWARAAQKLFHLRFHDHVRCTPDVCRGKRVASSHHSRRIITDLKVIDIDYYQQVLRRVARERCANL